MLKRIFYSVLVIVLLLFLAFYIIKITNWERYAPWFERTIQQATGRTLTIKGPIHFAWNKHPIVTLENLAFSNVAWSPVDTAAQIKKLTIEFRVLPLFKKQIDVIAVNIENAQFLVQHNASNVSNWYIEKKNQIVATGFTLRPHSAPKVSLNNTKITMQPYEGIEKIIALKTATLLLQPDKKRLAIDAAGKLNGIGFHVKTTVIYPKDLESGIYQLNVAIGENGPSFSMEL